MVTWLMENWETVVVVASVVATLLNWVIRKVQDAGGSVPRWLLAAVAFVVNVPALNFDKAAQQLKGGRGPALEPPK